MAGWVCIAFALCLRLVTGQYFYEPPPLGPRQPCEETLQAEHISVVSSKYQRDGFIDCTYKVQKFSSEVCMLMINFKQFELRSSPDCQDEYVTIDGEPFCGNFIGLRQYTFNKPQILITYRGSASSKYHLDMKQILCPPKQKASTCDLVSSQQHTEIVSPNYPSPYPPDTTCQYLILPANPSICLLNIVFHDFDVEDYFDCQRDRLFIDGRAYCGALTGRKLSLNMTKRGQTLQFLSDSVKNNRGFSISLEQVSCIFMNRTDEKFTEPQVQPIQECCNRVYSSSYSILQSPGFLGDSPNVGNCRYTILPASPQFCRLKIHFKHFWVGEEDVFYGCINGFLEIDGRRICGCRDGLTITTFFNGGPKNLQYHLQDRGLRGFVAEVYQEECSPITPAMNRPTVDPNTEIEVFSTNTSEKAVSRFFVPSQVSLCYRWGSADWLAQIRQFLYNVASSFQCPPVVPPAYPPIGVPPVAPPSYPPSYPPISVPPIAPPSYPPSYPPISVPPIAPPSYPPSYPPISVPPIAPPSYPPSYPPISVPPIAPPSYPPISIPPVAPPFYPPIAIPPVAPPVFPIPGCVVLSSLQGTISTPGYPRHYPPNLRCCFRFQQLPGICQIQLSVLDFDVEWSPKCWKDYFLFDRRRRFCGQTLQATTSILHFHSDGLAYLDFVSDKFFQGRGFRAIYQMLPCAWSHGRSPLVPQSEVPPTTEIPTPYPPATSPGANDGLDINVTTV